MIQPEDKTVEKSAERAGVPRARDLRFADAREAGRALAPKLDSYAGADGLVVVGLAHGGVAVAFEVARALGATLDVLLIRRLLVPRGTERTPVGSTITKSRIPHDLSAGGSAHTPYLSINPWA